MISASRTRAKKLFDALDKKKLKGISEQEKAECAINEKTARLRALRLAKEAADQAEKSAK